MKEVQGGGDPEDGPEDDNFLYNPGGLNQNWNQITTHEWQQKLLLYIQIYLISFNDLLIWLLFKFIKFMIWIGSNKHHFAAPYI